MGKRGPKPKSESELVARGSTVPRRREAAKEKLDAVGGAGLPKQPTWMSDDERAVWSELAPTLVDMGIISVADGQVLARYCHCLIEWTKITEQMRTAKLLIKTRGMVPYQNPLLKIKSELAKELQHLEDRFGLTPAARMTLNVTAMFRPGYKRPTDGDQVKAVPKDPSTPIGGERFFKRPG